MSGWSIDQRAELTEALAEADIAHVWEGDEVVVPEELEAQVDELFARLEELLGPFAVALGGDDPGVEFGLDEWPTADRQHADPGARRGRGAAPLGRHDGGRGHRRRVHRRRAARRHRAGHAGARRRRRPRRRRAPWTRCSPRRTAWPSDPDDRTGRDELSDLAPQLDPAQPPYGVSVGTWAKTVEAAARARRPGRRRGHASSDIIGAAQDAARARPRVRRRLRPVPSRDAPRRARGLAHPAARTDAAPRPRQPRAAGRPGARVRRAAARRRRRRSRRRRPRSSSSPTSTA